MKNLICAALVGCAATLGAGEFDKTQECIDRILQIENYQGVHGERILNALGNPMTVEEFGEKFNQEYRKEEFQAFLRDAFTKKFTPDEIDDIYELINSDLYKKYNTSMSVFTLDVTQPITQIFMRIFQPEGAEEAKPSIPNKIVEANQDNIEAIIAEHENVVVDLYTNWCGPCKALAPILEELSNEFDGKYLFVKIDGEANSSLISKFNVRGFPTILFFKNGQEESRQVGFAPKEQLMETMSACFNK